MRIIWDRLSTNMDYPPIPILSPDIWWLFVEAVRLSLWFPRVLFTLFLVNWLILSNIAVMPPGVTFPGLVCLYDNVVFYIMVAVVFHLPGIQSAQYHFLTSNPATPTANHNGEDFALLLAGSGTAACSG